MTSATSGSSPSPALVPLPSDSRLAPPQDSAREGVAAGVSREMQDALRGQPAVALVARSRSADSLGRLALDVSPLPHGRGSLVVDGKGRAARHGSRPDSRASTGSQESNISLRDRFDFHIPTIDELAGQIAALNATMDKDLHAAQYDMSAWLSIHEQIGEIARTIQVVPGATERLAQHLVPLTEKANRTYLGPSAADDKSHRRDSSEGLHFNDPGFVREGQLSTGAMRMEVRQGAGVEGPALFNPFAVPESSPAASRRIESGSPSPQKSPLSRPHSPLVAKQGLAEQFKGFFRAGEKPQEASQETLQKCELADIRNKQHVFHRAWRKFEAAQFADENSKFLNAVRDFKAALELANRNPQLKPACLLAARAAADYSSLADVPADSLAAGAGHPTVNLSAANKAKLRGISSGQCTELAEIADSLEDARREIYEMSSADTFKRFKALGIDKVNALLE